MGADRGLLGNAETNICDQRLSTSRSVWFRAAPTPVLLGSRAARCRQESFCLTRKMVPCDSHVYSVGFLWAQMSKPLDRSKCGSNSVVGCTQVRACLRASMGATKQAWARFCGRARPCVRAGIVRLPALRGHLKKHVTESNHILFRAFWEITF